MCSVDDAASYFQSGNCSGPGGYYLPLIQGAQTKLGLSPSAAANFSLIGSGKGLDVVDNRTLVIRIIHPAAYFLDQLDYPTAYPVEKSLIVKYPGGTWVDHLNEGGCSGPFMVKSYNRGRELADGSQSVLGASLGQASYPDRG